MKATPTILTEFNAFTLQSKIAQVKLFFKENTYSHFPVVNNKKLIGLISETDIQGVHENENTLASYKESFYLFFTENHTNFLEILNAFAINETNLVPVVSKDQTYVGYYDLIDILHIYNNSPFSSNEGTILLLEKEIRAYSFSEICQIVESNNGKVLGIFISKTTPSSVTITLKFNASEVNEIIQSFRRFDYHVLSKHKEDFLLEELKDRTNYLQKYLNI
jgi:Mg/Co/Ni transporter MgtE